jgi:hypothetical protein
MISPSSGVLPGAGQHTGGACTAENDGEELLGHIDTASVPMKGDDT